MVYKANKGIKELIGNVAKDAFEDEINAVREAIVRNSIATLKEVVLNIADGRNSFDEFAERIIIYVDTKVEEKKAEGFLYLAGKLIFEDCKDKKNTVLVSYELYFLGKDQKCIKSGACCEIPSSHFKKEDLLKLNNLDKIEYEVEG